ncbi:unnamed protein product [Caenorhabditis auriculariae]|uniref:Uncharacterized protein n=1 Tax=Caenorhabditis auriculariae TaxID=2777116 RepID=A0A8S1GQI6_9PELO|nr:unnamed protein product [Caenorhabditis auriculariae]
MEPLTHVTWFDQSERKKLERKKIEIQDAFYRLKKSMGTVAVEYEVCYHLLIRGKVPTKEDEIWPKINFLLVRQPMAYDIQRQSRFAKEANVTEIGPKV